MYFCVYDVTWGRVNFRFGILGTFGDLAKISTKGPLMGQGELQNLTGVVRLTTGYPRLYHTCTEKCELGLRDTENWTLKKHHTQRGRKHGEARARQGTHKKIFAPLLAIF